MNSILDDVSDNQIVKAYTRLGKASNKANGRELLDYRIASITIPDRADNAEEDLKTIAKSIRDWCSTNPDVSDALMMEVYKG